VCPSSMNAIALFRKSILYAMSILYHFLPSLSRLFIFTSYIEKGEISVTMSFSEILDFLSKFLFMKLGDGSFNQFVIELFLKFYTVWVLLFAWSLKPLIWLQNLFQR
jgi:hypothetical protein